MIDPDLTDERYTPVSRPRRPWYQPSVRGSLALIFGIGCAFGVVAWLGREIGRAREAARHAQCLSNMKQIALALHNYHDAYGVLPPAHIDDLQGKPMHSWRVLLLPFMEQHALYNAYNFSEPWDGPGNRKLLNLMPTVFSCPSRDQGLPTSLTCFVAVTGPHTTFPDDQARAFAQITDGIEKTILLVEVENVDIAWTEPRDLAARTMSDHVNDPHRAGISSPHPRGATVGFVDQSVRSMTERVGPKKLRAFITVDGGETIDPEAALSGR